MHAPLKPGFLFHRDNGDSTWISLKYERLDIYCSICGCIGHKDKDCCAPPEDCFPAKYKLSLKVNIFSNLPPFAVAKDPFSTTTSSLPQPSSAQTSPIEVMQSANITHNSHRHVTISHLTPLYSHHSSTYPCSLTLPPL
jgi:hypothetical protein